MSAGGSNEEDSGPHWVHWSDSQVLPRGRAQVGDRHVTSPDLGTTSCNRHLGSRDSGGYVALFSRPPIHNFWNTSRQLRCSLGGVGRCAGRFVFDGGVGVERAEGEVGSGVAELVPLTPPVEHAGGDRFGWQVVP